MNTQFYYEFDPNGKLGRVIQGKNSIKEFKLEKTWWGWTNKSRMIQVDGKKLDKYSLVEQLNKIVKDRKLNKSENIKIPTLFTGYFFGSSNEKIIETYKLISKRLKAENNFNQNIEVIKKWHKNIEVETDVEKNCQLYFSNPSDLKNFVSDYHINEEDIEEDANEIHYISLTTDDVQKIVNQIKAKEKEKTFEDTEKILQKSIEELKPLLQAFGDEIVYGKDHEKKNIVLHFEEETKADRFIGLYERHLDPKKERRRISEFDYKLSTDDVKKIVSQINKVYNENLQTLNKNLSIIKDELREYTPVLPLVKTSEKILPEPKARVKFLFRRLKQDEIKFFTEKYQDKLKDDQKENFPNEILFTAKQAEEFAKILLEEKKRKPASDVSSEEVGKGKKELDEISEKAWSILTDNRKRYGEIELIPSDGTLALQVRFPDYPTKFAFYKEHQKIMSSLPENETEGYFENSTLTRKQTMAFLELENQQSQGPDYYDEVMKMLEERSKKKK